MENTTTPNVKAKITWMNNDLAAARKASADFTIADAFQVHGISILQGKKGLFLSMPQRQATDKDGNKTYVDVAHPVTGDMRKAIYDAVLGAYSQKMAMANEYKAGYQADTGPVQSSAPEGNATEDELPQEITEPEESSEEDEDESFAPIMGQMM